MKKVFRFFAIAALAFGMTTMVACKGDDEGEEGGNQVAGNVDNLPTTLSETFDNGVPEGWTNIDADGDGLAWQNWFYLQDGSREITEGMVISASFLNTLNALEPDNYLVTPKIYIEDGATLSYDVGGIDKSYYKEHYAVLLGTVENGVFKTEATIVEEEVPSVTATTRTFNLSEYKGKSVSIAFRHFDITDMYIMTLDNVKVTK